MSLLAFALFAAAAPERIGIFSGWGAFQDPGTRCYAIAEPVPGSSAAAARAFASVGTWPTRGVRNQINLRLSHVANSRGRVTLSIDERRFELIAQGAEAWAPDRQTDAAIVDRKSVV